MSKKITHIVSVLDRSGSMKHLVDEVIGSFNNFVEEQKKLDGKAELTLVVFDENYEVIYDRVDIQKVEPLTTEQYYARGMTALNDAIGNTIETFKKKKNVIFLVQTDGHENSSHKFTNSDIKKLVEDKQSKGWEFVFFGANIDAFAEGNCRGFKNTQGFMATVKGVKDSYMSLTRCVKSYRSKH
jgi:uncharacterized protein YegL